MQAALKHTLLGKDDPDPVEVLNAQSAAPVLLVCEHAGQAIPAALGGLQLDEGILDSHRGWDIGAEEVARRLAVRLSAPLVIQRYSRLVIDCNRPPGGLQSMPTESDGALIPGNADLDAADISARIEEIFTPLDRAITRAFSVPRRACFSIHSYTPRFGGQDRPWHAGFLTRRSQSTGRALMASILARQPYLNLCLNQPYQVDDETDWFIPRHAEQHALPHCLIEIRNDQIDHPAGADLWADLLGQAIDAFMETPT